MGGQTSSDRGDAIVGARYCTSHTVELVITKKAMNVTESDYTVTDVNGKVVFKVRGRAFSFKGRVVLMDSDGKTLVSMQAKGLTLHDQWKAFKGESSKSKDLLFSAKRAAMFQMKTELDVFLASNKDGKICDFKLKDTYTQKSCTIYNGNSSAIIAKAIEKTSIKNQLLGKDTFRITIYPDIDQAFVVSLIIILIQINGVPDYQNNG